MVKIELSKETRKYIDDQHREYIEITIVPRLEMKIKEYGEDDEKGRFLKTLFGDTEDKRKSCIINFCISPNLIDLLKTFEDVFNDTYGFEYRSESEEHRKIIKDMESDINFILNYEGFNIGKAISKNVKWSRHIFITSLGIKVCPYCNRQYITSYENDEAENRTTADADHYYPKAKYPILQMNIFNLVPSCNVCNSKTKGSKLKKHLYPYEDESDSLSFEIPTEISDRVSEILINTKMNKKAEASVEVFKLDKIYQAHLDEVSEIKERAKEYYAFKEKAYEATHGLKVPFNIFNLWFEFMGKNISSEPLIKLKQDVFKQLKNELQK
ncbi:hypothetical protein GPL15_10355 [Clostridium sp. MCC353]|uniref:hypothetical protein n=1 Tax=Clostridium sp. MCC353 TaxID=2592646 RepID=UPI001C02E81C|nr:hypothetical protein [Clostridium sp. MCC353]MBT9776906.1 hypothetical protein [Clostridium sp. MCC353]